MNIKKIILLLTSLIFLLSCTQQKEEKSYGIPWEKSLKIAFKKSKDKHKILMIMATSKGCRWCIKMKKETLSNPKVAKELQKFVLAKANRETPSQREQLPPFQHVPVIFFFTPNGEEIDNLRGYFNADDFLTYLHEIENENE